MVKKYIIVFGSLLLTFCSTPKFENEDVVYYENGQVKECKRWNKSNSDTEYIQFGISGDTLFSRKIIEKQMAEFSYKHDTALYAFYLENDSSNFFVNEYLHVKKNKILEDMNNYFVFVKEINDSISLIYKGEDIYSYKLILINKDDFAKVDTVLADVTKNQISLSKNILSQKYIWVEIWKLTKSNTDGTKEISIVKFFLNPIKQIEFQNFFKINESLFRN